MFGHDKKSFSFPPVCYPTKQQLYSHLTLICKTNQVRQTRHVEHCWRSKDEIISDVLRWTPSHDRASVDEPAILCEKTRTHIKARIDKTQQNSKCRLCGDRDETTNHIISECSKLAQKEYKTRHGWVGKVIYWEMCKKFKFDHTNKWYMHNPVSVLENDTHKHLWDFDIQTDNLISARQPDLLIIN